VSDLEAETTQDLDGPHAGVRGTKLSITRPTLHPVKWKTELFESNDSKGQPKGAQASGIDDGAILDGGQDNADGSKHNNHNSCKNNKVHHDDNDRTHFGTIRQINNDFKDKSRRRPSRERRPSSEPPFGVNLLEKPIHRRPSLFMLMNIVNLKEINSCYKLDREVGRGSFASVIKGYSRVTNAARAIKCVSKQRMLGKEHHIDKEIDILKSIDHPNVVKLYELFEDSDNIYMVLEMCFGGALLDYVRRGGHLDESQGANVMLQLLRAVFYLHANRICHRDIKPANCLLVNKGTMNSNLLKLSDLGLACRFEPGQVLKHSVGTLTYMAPEVLEKQYDCNCDLWSCGVLLFKILSGREPFAGKSDEETREKIATGKVTFSPSDWVHVTEDAMGLVQGLLRVNLNDRYTVAKALDHPWIKKKAVEAASVVVDEDLLINLRTFRSLNSFKRSALQVIASMLSDDKLAASKHAFVAFDEDGDGHVSFNELASRLQAVDGSFTNQAALDCFLETGSDKEFKKFTYTEFLAATFDRKRYCQRDVCLAAFSSFDLNGDGFVVAEELTQTVLAHLPPDEAIQILRDFDVNGDGVLSFEDFLEMMQDGKGWSPQTTPTSSSTFARSGSGRLLSRADSTNSFSRAGSQNSTKSWLFSPASSLLSENASSPKTPTASSPFIERRKEKERPKFSSMVRRLSAPR